MFGSKADLTAAKSDFRFTPESGLRTDIAPCRFGANRVAYCPHIIKTERQALAPRQIDDPMLVYL
jgi:hypothetical protein